MRPHLLRMSRGRLSAVYSKLLVYEIVLPASVATSLMTTLDLQLMNVLSGLKCSRGPRTTGESCWEAVALNLSPLA